MAGGSHWGLWQDSRVYKGYGYWLLLVLISGMYGWDEIMVMVGGYDLVLWYNFWHKSGAED